MCKLGVSYNQRCLTILDDILHFRGWMMYTWSLCCVSCFVAIWLDFRELWQLYYLQVQQLHQHSVLYEDKVAKM